MLADIAAVHPQESSQTDAAGSPGSVPARGMLRGQIRAVFIASLAWKRWLIFLNRSRAVKVLTVLLRDAVERSLCCGLVALWGPRYRTVHPARLSSSTTALHREGLPADPQRLSPTQWLNSPPRVTHVSYTAPSLSKISSPTSSAQAPERAMHDPNAAVDPDDILLMAQQRRRKKFLRVWYGKVRTFKPAARLLCMMLRPLALRVSSSAFSTWKAAAASDREAHRLAQFRLEHDKRRKSMDELHHQELQRAQQAIKEAQAHASLQCGLRDVEAEHRSNAERRLYLQRLALLTVKAVASSRTRRLATAFRELVCHAVMARSDAVLRGMEETLAAEASKREDLAAVLRLTEADAEVSAELRRAVVAAELNIRRCSALASLTMRLHTCKQRQLRWALLRLQQQRESYRARRRDALVVHLALSKLQQSRMLRFWRQWAELATIEETSSIAVQCEPENLVGKPVSAPAVAQGKTPADSSDGMCPQFPARVENPVVVSQTSFTGAHQAALLSERAEKLLRLKVKLGLQQDFLEQVWQVPRPLARSAGPAEQLDVLSMRLARGSAMLLGYVLTATFQARLRIGINALLAACLEAELQGAAA
mmetsp:Transcript_9435/g.17118  ORF Transcript_9435/g.17118 Transcript_9435/m.17118 type:complete len:594 (-) Transcript_9435:142-1923(-)